MTTTDVHDRVLAKVDELRDEMIDLLCRMINIPSPPGYEKDVCDFLAKWFRDHGLKGETQEFEPTRANVIGTLEGIGGGKSLMLNSHMDTTFSGVEEDDLYILGKPEHMSLPQAEVRNGVVYGLGAVNDKGPFAAAVLAVRAIQESGVRLRGDVLLTGVGGEIGRGQVWPHRGPHTRGKGLGAWHLIGNGVWPDYFINAEASGYSISWGLPGAAYFRVTTRGVPTYAPLNVDRRSPTPAENPNAIVKMAHLIPAIEEWADRYEAENTYPLGENGGVIEPKVTIGAIDGGLATKPNWRPALCNIYVDVRIPPHRSPLDVKREFEAMIRATGLSDEVTMFMARRGYVSSGHEPVAQALREAHQRVFNAPPPLPTQTDTSMWNDSNIFWQAGIPGVKYGPPRSIGQRYPEGIDIADLVNTAKVYALACLRVCGVEE